MKLRVLIPLLPALLSLAACQETASEMEAPESRTLTFTATYDTPEAVSRTQRQADNSVWWMPGNTISVQRVAGYRNKGEFTTGITQPSATAHFSGTLPEYATFDDYIAIYPFSQYDSADEYNAEEDYYTLTLDIPNQQTAAENTFADGQFYSLARTKDNTLHFRHLTGGIKFSVTSPGITEVALVVPQGESSSLNNRLAGTVFVNLYQDRVEVSPQQYLQPYSSITLKAPEGQTLVPGSAYYITTLPTTLPDGFTFIFKKGSVWGKRVYSKPVTIKSARFGTLLNADEGIEWKGTGGGLEDYGFEPLNMVSYIHAGFGSPDATRTELQEGGKVFWSPGDAIRVFQVRLSGAEWESGGELFTTAITSPSPTATFTGTLPVAKTGYEDAETRYWAIYPDNPALEVYEDMASHSLPAQQTGLPGTFPSNLSPAFAYSKDPTEMTFQHPMSGLQLSVTTPGITKITFQAKGGLWVNGDYNVSYNNYTGLITTTGYSSGLDANTAYRSIIELTPEGASSFQTGQVYYIIIPPMPMDQGFSLMFEKADGSYAARNIAQSVTFNRAKFRTLPQADEGLSWNAPGINLDEPSVQVPWYGNLFTVTAHSPKDYEVSVGCDWITEVFAKDSDRIRSIYSVDLGGDARFDGCLHGFLCKANPGAERSADITFSDGTHTTVLTVTQASGSHIPVITRHHIGTCVDHYGNRNPIYNWFFHNAMDSENFGETFTFYSIFSHSTSSDNISEGLSTGFATQFNAWGSIDGRSKITNRDNYDQLYTLMQETDDYYLPRTSLGITTTLDEENRKVTAEVTLYAAQAGTYKLLGAVVDGRFYYNIGILYSHDIYNLIRKPLFTSDYGDEITFDAPGTKTFSYTIDLPDEFAGQAGTWGQRKDQFILFTVKAQYEDQVRIADQGQWDWYFDNSRWLGYDASAPLEVAGM